MLQEKEVVGQIRDGILAEINAEFQMKKNRDACEVISWVVSLDEI